jgi:HSP20 family molecular chaperone IbpA
MYWTDYPKEFWKEEKDKGVLIIEAPGFKKKNIKVEATPGRVEVVFDRGKRIEAFSRQYTINKEFNSPKAKAEYQDGVLEITIPKQERAIPKAIEIIG